MYFRILLFGLLTSCAAPPPPKPVLMPPTKALASQPNEETIYTLGYMSDYEIWEFLRDKPSENVVLDNIGLPDSVWRSDNDSTKFLYYFVDKIKDYNIIEIDSYSNQVTGFEWD